MNTTPNSDSNSDQPSPEDAANRPASAGGKSGGNAGRSGSGTKQSAIDEKTRKADVPQREPLTPDEVEDEALRGDFMLRWALVLLALLIGCTAITDTQTLLHVKSGQYTLENVLPARTGVFSSTAEDRPWRNLSWLFDAVLAAMYAVGGATALSIFKAILAAVIFGTIVHTNRKDASTWWGTICAALALIVCHRQLTARPEIVTLLGLAVTLRLLHRWREERQTKYLKALVAVFLLWSNMDAGMFYGLVVVIGYAVGETSGNWLGYAGLDNDTHRKYLWLAAGGCVAATLLNPFGWHALLAPVSLYATEYPAWQEYYPLRGKVGFVQLQYHPIWQPEFWSSLDSAAVAGLVIAGAALISFVLNFRRLDFGDFIVWLAFVALAGIATHEMAAAAIVSAVLATVNAQQWYQHTFRQTYSVETSELVFSRGGRAVTVLALFGLAYLSGSGLWGGLQTRSGLGLHPDLQASIDSFESELQDAYDERPFNFVVWQGDVLAWIGRKPFIDSRLSLYAGNGDDDLLKIHKECRAQLARADRSGPSGREWRATLDRFQITHVVPRMDSRIVKTNVTYQVVFTLLRSGDWQMTGFGATAAVFHRTDLKDEKYVRFLRRSRVDFVKLAFHTTNEDSPIRDDWARGKSFTERWIQRPRHVTPNAVEQSRNYLEMIARSIEGGFPQLKNGLAQNPRSLMAAAAHLVIRNSNSALARNPQNGDAHRMQGHAYYWLSLAEQGDAAVRQRRYTQAAAALAQALTIDPDDETALRMQAHIHTSVNAFDFAVDEYERCIELLDKRSSLTKDELALREHFVKQKQNAQQAVARGQEYVAKEKKDLGEDDASRYRRFQIASAAEARFGCVRLAIELLEEDRELIAATPTVAYFYVNLLLRAGRARDAVDQIQQLEQRQGDFRPPIAYRSMDAFAALTRADYTGAERIWSVSAQELDAQRFQGLMATLPFSIRGPEAAALAMRQRSGQGRNSPPAVWATDQMQALGTALYDIPFSIAGLKMQIALTQMETGHPQRAVPTLRELLAIAPESPLRSLAGFYLNLLTGEQIPPLQKTTKPGAATPKSNSKAPSSAPVRAPKPGTRTAP